MSNSITLPLGDYSGRTYYTSIRATPSFNDPEEFAVTAHYRDRDTDDEIQIARIDTAHGYTHFDRLFRRDQPKERLDVGVWEAAEIIEENWRTYARSYERVFG